MSSNRNNARYVGGIDSGLDSGGLVVIDRSDRERVLLAVSLGEQRGALARYTKEARSLAGRFGGWSDIEFIAAELRANAWIARLVAALDAFEAEHGEVACFGVESFIDQHQHAKRMMRNRWHTPFLMGKLSQELAERDVTPENGRLVYQNAGVVLPQFKDERARLKARRSNDRDLVVPGDRQVTNDHLRSALSHALALSLRLPAYRPAGLATA